jgi:2,4-dienoyl-CoA reductase-like NADH-dependent reductase (Old Yellow Enzyme family)/thioredoxin reductase
VEELVMSMTDLLFEPLRVKNCVIPNRLSVAPMVTNFCNNDGTVSDQFSAYILEKAKGGWGLIIPESCRISEHSGAYLHIPGLWKDAQMPGYKKLADQIHSYGSKTFLQLIHAGRQSSKAFNGGVQPVAPSAIPCPRMKEMPRELTIGEIEQIVEDFASSALRARECGYDGVQIHGGHGDLLSQVLSTSSNKRTDRYGGCLKNRLLLMKQIIEAVRARVGGDFPVTYRISADEFIPGGVTLADTRAAVIALEEYGYDGFNVTASLYGQPMKEISPSMYVPHAWLADYAAAVKEVVSVPVAAVNRINDPLIAASLLKAGKADMICMGRQSLADPYFPQKAREGKPERIRYCIACQQGCTMGIRYGGQMGCLVNPAIGREYMLDLEPAAEKRVVYIAGGGVAGMEAARGAAIKGHEVHLFESSGALGGQFVAAAFPPAKGGLASYTGWLIGELEEKGVAVYLNTPLTAERIAADKPGHIIVATGGKPLLPPIPGIGLPNVVTAEDALLGVSECGEHVIVAGGGEVGCETAAHLALQGKKVSVVEMLPEMAREMTPATRYALMQILAEHGVKLYNCATVTEILEDGVSFRTPDAEHKLKADTVVVGFGYAPDRRLEQSLTQNGVPFTVIAGAKETTNAQTAAREGFLAGLGI